jgi:hypothetical protein
VRCVITVISPDGSPSIPPPSAAVPPAPPAPPVHAASARAAAAPVVAAKMCLFAISITLVSIDSPGVSPAGRATE